MADGNISDEYTPLCDGLGSDHRHSNGEFFNPWSRKAQKLGRSFSPGLLLKFITQRREEDKIVPNCLSQSVLNTEFPVIPLEKGICDTPPTSGMRCIWLGHATSLVQFDGVTILTDPALSYRCSPVPFAGPKRLRRIPCEIEDLPCIDIVVVSHSHYDHLDYNTVKELSRHQGPGIHWYVGLGLKGWFTSIGCENVYEMDWWQEEKYNDTITVAFTPAQHWSKRSPTDTNKTLWGGFVVMGQNYRFYHAGDTGYCQTFKAIGEKYGPIDFSTIPIGAYHPRDFLKCQHVDPPEAVCIHKDVKSRRSLGIHWGTFLLGREAFLEPPRYLKECTLKEGLASNEFFTCKIGEVVEMGSAVPES